MWILNSLVLIMYVISPSESATYGYGFVHNMTVMTNQPQGESSQLSLFLRFCKWCGEAFDPSLWPRWKVNPNTHFCGQQCACAHNSHEGWKHRKHRRTNWSASTLTTKERQRTRALTRGMIRRGEIVIPKRCQRCRKNDRALQTHHLDYTQPARVRFLCLWCHTVENRIMREQFKKHTPTVSAQPAHEAGDPCSR